MSDSMLVNYILNWTQGYGTTIVIYGSLPLERELW